MDTTKHRAAQLANIRSFPICLDRSRPRTILGIVGRLAANQATAGRNRQDRSASTCCPDRPAA